MGLYRSECHDQLVLHLIANIGELIGILQMLAVLISGSQTPTKATTQLKDPNRKNGLEKTTKMYFTVILRAILYEKCIEKEWQKSVLNSLELIQQAKDLQTKLE